MSDGTLTINYVSVGANGTSSSQVLDLPRFTEVNTKRPNTDKIVTLLGGFGINGAICLTGGQNVTRIEHNGIPPDRPTSFDPTKGIDAQVYVAWRVNAGRGRWWQMHVALEPDETYTMRLTSLDRRQVRIDLLGETTQQPDDDLINACDALYVDAVNKYLDGAIPFD